MQVQLYVTKSILSSFLVHLVLTLSLTLSVGKFLHYAEAISGEVPESVDV